jgi:CRP/FNR family transcriptional regulator, anaerobic regulatory protein
MHDLGRLEPLALEGSAAEMALAPAPPGRGAPSPVLLGIEIPDPHWGESLALIKRSLQFTRRTMHAGDPVQLAGDAFIRLHVVNSGVFKTVNLATDGREQIVGLHFKGDWIGFDGVASGHCACDAVALDTGEVWSLRYVALLESAATSPALMHSVHQAMSRQLARDREWRLALGTLSADARVADFVRYWAESLAERGLRTDQFTLRMTRAEIGTYLGMTLETVSRAFTRLVRSGLIRFDERGRRDIAIPSIDALAQFVRRSVNPPEPRTLQ